MLHQNNLLAFGPRDESPALHVKIERVACVRLGIGARQDREGGALLPGRRTQEAGPLRQEVAGATAARTGTPVRRPVSDQRRMPIYRVLEPRFGRLHM